MAEIRRGASRPGPAPRKVAAKRGLVRVGQMFGVEIRVEQTFEPHVPGQRAVLARIGAMAADRIRRRIQGRQVDADGRPLPALGDALRRYVEGPDGLPVDGRSVEAKRSGVILWMVKTRQSGYEVGDTVRLQRRNGSWIDGTVREGREDAYARRKQRAGAKGVRDGLLTGAMWRALAVTVQDKGVADKRIRIYFAGTDKAQRRVAGKTAGGKVSRRAIKHETKAYLSQYPHRTRDGGAKGSPAFTLMALSAGELAELRDHYLSRLRLFRGVSGRT